MTPLSPILQLGGDAAVVITEDADIDQVMSRLLVGSFKYAGQICISVQRVLVHRSRLSEVRSRLVREAREMRVGPPLDTGIDIGPMISDDAAERAIALVDDAVAVGGRLHTGGTREGAYVRPTVLEDVPGSARLATEEAFSPIVRQRRR